MWLQKTQPDKPWSQFAIKLPQKVQAMFAISMVMEVGNGQSTLFWTDRWILGHSVGDLAPSLLPFVKKQALRKRTVQDALQNDDWLQDFGRGFSVGTIWEFI